MKGDEGALIAGAVAGRTHAEIAVEADVSVSTVQRRLRDPRVLAAVQEGRTQQRREAIGRLNNHVPAAIKRLGDLVMSDDPKVALRAIGLVLGQAHKFTIDLDERASLLETKQLSEEMS